MPGWKMMPKISAKKTELTTSHHETPPVSFEKAKQDPRPNQHKT